MALSITDVDNRIGGGITLTVGKQWSSFEQFRREGVFGIRQAIPEGTIGTIRLGSLEYVLLRRADFNRLHGLASEVRRLSRGIVLLRQAVELVMRRPDEEISLRHLHDLTMEFTLPTSTMSWSGEIELDVDQAPEPVSRLDPQTFDAPRARTRRQESTAR